MAKETRPHPMSETLRRGQLLSPSLNPTLEKGRSRLRAGPSPPRAARPAAWAEVLRALLDEDSVRKGTPSLIKFELKSHLERVTSICFHHIKVGMQVRVDPRK